MAKFLLAGTSGTIKTMKCAVRIKSLSLGGSPDSSLAGQQAHGMRLDGSSGKRRVRDAEPLVWGSLDLRSAFDKHVSGCRQNAGLKKPVLHAILQFPTEIPLTADNEQKMMRFAVQFINDHHGGDAVFAGRLDRDEAGRHTVDIFFTPKYVKETKNGSATWISTTKHGKALCERYRAEIERRHGGRFLTGPRQVGISMQNAFREFLIGKNLKLEPKVEKQHTAPDRLTPEQYARRAAEDNARRYSIALKDQKRELGMKIKVLQGLVERLQERFNVKFKLHPRYRSDDPRPEPPRPSGPPM